MILTKQINLKMRGNENWERLVRATLRREEIWQMFHDHSRTPSHGSTSSETTASPNNLSTPKIGNAGDDIRQVSILSAPLPSPNDMNKIKRTMDYWTTMKYYYKAAVDAFTNKDYEKTQRFQKEVYITYLKVVLKLDFVDDKIKQKAMQKVSRISGVESIAVDSKDKKFTVTGDIDTVSMVAKLRKLCYTEIVSVGFAKEPEKKKEEPKKDDAKKDGDKKKDDMKKKKMNLRKILHKF